ncbi:eCIS core domain-containing protein [Streptomyces cyaneofuscatus]
MRAQDSDRTAGPAKARRTGAGSAAPQGGVSGAPLAALQRAIGNAAVSRLIGEARHQHGADCGHQQDSAPVQRSAVHDVLRGSGQPMAAPLRQEMEARLGADFSDVRLHTGTTARRSAGEIGARAYTSGSNIVVGDGGADKHTLAHELTHVIQQRQGPVAGTARGDGLRVSDPSDRFEREAEATANRVMSAPVPSAGRAPEPAPGPQSATAGDGAVQRALVTEDIDRWRERLGLASAPMVVEVPAGMSAATPFSEYPAESRVNLTPEALALNVNTVTGMAGDDAVQIVSSAGGGAYMEEHRILLVNHEVTGDYTKNQTIMHELGHQKQQEGGIDINQQRNSKALVEYHNIIVNENVLTRAEDEQAKPRFFYSGRGDSSLSTETRARMTDAGWAPIPKVWDLMQQHVAEQANDNEKRLLQEITAALDSEENAARYGEKSGNKFSKSYKEAIKANLAGLYFTGKFAAPTAT